MQPAFGGDCAYAVMGEYCSKRTTFVGLISERPPMPTAVEGDSLRDRRPRAWGNQVLPWQRWMSTSDSWTAQIGSSVLLSRALPPFSRPAAPLALPEADTSANKLVIRACLALSSLSSDE